MKKLSVMFFIILALLAGCIRITQVTGAATTAPAPTPLSPTAIIPPGPTADDTTGPVDSLGPDVSSIIGPPPALPVVNARTLVYDNEHIDVDISCPEISGMLDAVLQQDVNDKAYYDQKNQAVEIEQASVDDPAPTSIYSLASSFAVHRNDGLFLSISEDIDYFRGGANVGADLKFINLMNTVPGRQLALADLFQPGADYITLINDRISGMIAANPDMSDFTFSTINGDQGFYLTGSDLVIAFQNYDIAPGVYGPQEFAIPFADLSDVLIPELVM